MVLNASQASIPCAAVPRPKSETVFRSDFQDRASEVDSRISVAFAFGATPLSRSDHRLQAFPCALRRRDSCRNASGTHLSISTSYSRAIYTPPSPTLLRGLERGGELHAYISWLQKTYSQRSVSCAAFCRDPSEHFADPVGVVRIAPDRRFVQLSELGRNASAHTIRDPISRDRSSG